MRAGHARRQRTCSHMQRTCSHMHLATSISAYRDPCGSKTEPVSPCTRTHTVSIAPRFVQSSNTRGEHICVRGESQYDMRGPSLLPSSTNHLDAPGRRARGAVAVVERANLRAQRVPRGVPRLLVLLVLIEESASAARRGQQERVGDCAPVHVPDSHALTHT
jgi:hypothetical protein